MAATNSVAVVAETVVATAVEVKPEEKKRKPETETLERKKQQL